MTAFESIVPEELNVLHAERGHSPAVRVGQLLLISGMLGRDEALNIVIEPEAQITRLFQNMELVLSEAGCAWCDVAELTAYLTHIQRDFELFMKVRNTHICQPFPAMTMIGITELAQPGLICEVKGIAVIPGSVSAASMEHKMRVV